MRPLHIARLAQIVLLVSLTVSCASKGPYQMDLMPAPDIYDAGSVNPFADDSLVSEQPYRGVLYATDRLPVTDENSKNTERFYQNERGHLLRVGIGEIGIGDENMTWADARRVSLLKNRPTNYPLQVTGVEEIGILESSFHDFVDPSLVGPRSADPGREFASRINRMLENSRNKDVYIYTHGYKVIFENPLLVSTELWHFLGYDGAFIAFSWPSTPKTSAYVRDLETAANSARGLRLLIEFVAEHTEAERIHIIGYSAGTRVVVKALSQLAMMSGGTNSPELRKDFRIGHVMLIGSDLDRSIFGFSLNDGLLEVVDDLAVYMSGSDKALGISKWVFSRQRLGQRWEPGTMASSVANYFRNNPSLVMIDVTDAEGSDIGNGHGYFRQSPWVSSDILLTLMFDLPPENRGLQINKETSVWSFPDNYIEMLTEDINTYVNRQ